jgi:hypothetical protein
MAPNFRPHLVKGTVTGGCRKNRSDGDKVPDSRRNPKITSHSTLSVVAERKILIRSHKRLVPCSRNVGQRLLRDQGFKVGPEATGRDDYSTASRTFNTVLQGRTPKFVFVHLLCGNIRRKIEIKGRYIPVARVDCGISLRARCSSETGMSKSHMQG